VRRSRFGVVDCTGTSTALCDHRPVTARRSGEDDLARVQVQLATAAAVATPLADLDPTSRDLSPVQPLLEQLLHVVADLLGTDMAVVWVIDPAADELCAAAWTGIADDYVRSLRVPIGSGSAGRAVAARRAVTVTDIEVDPSYGQFAAGAMQHGITSVLSMPMLTLAEEPMGALSAYYRVVTDPGPRERALVDAYARQAAEIVERARMYAEARELAELEQRRGVQLRALADAALALSAVDRLDELLTTVTEAAREIIGVHQAVTSRLPHGWRDAVTYVSLSESYARWREYDVVPQGLGVLNAVTRDNVPLRLTGRQLADHPEWRGLSDAPGHPPIPDYLAAPLIGRSGVNLGLIQLSHRVDDAEFTAEDEAILVQLAQMASSAVEGLESLERERAGRREAEDTAAAHAALAEASARFAEVLDSIEVAGLLAAAVVPGLAAAAAVHVVGETGTLVLAELRCPDPVRRARLLDVLERFPPSVEHARGIGRVLQTGEPEVVGNLSEEIVASLGAEGADALLLRTSVTGSGLCLPLIARGRLSGVLSLMRDEAYTEDDVSYLLDLAQRGALAMDNSSRYAFERDTAGALQRSLLPRSTPTTALLTTAARYLAGAQGTQVGGDWYDVIPVDEGRFVVIVGDVMGRGVRAAAVMGQLRATVRAYAVDGHRPADLLRRLDRVVQSLGGVHFTTCVVGLLDPVSRELCVAVAGHLPPLVVRPDGDADYLELDPGLPLGVGGADFVEQSITLEPGSTVLLYTDGLVEGRGLSVEEGMTALRDAVRAPVRSAEELCDRVLAAMGRDGDHDDDTAVLALLLDDGNGGSDREPLALELAASPESAAVAREALLRMLGDDAGEAADTAALLLTELVANAVRFAGGDLQVRAVVHSGLLLVEVCDTSERMPVPLGPRTPDAETGRGMILIGELADRWGAEPLPTGKRVWFELSL
jgi:GAF domain-containing protein